MIADNRHEDCHHHHLDSVALVKEQSHFPFSDLRQISV